jgi:glyoxylase-like metal-dependent hydrolase (beta-lactamase superfamily II)
MLRGMPAFMTPLGDGIYCIDTGFQREGFDAAYLVVERDQAVFIDAGTNHAVPRLLAALDSVGVARSQVAWVIPTHVHLDHAGGAGLLMEQLPSARLLVHPRGARHMIDPSKLYEGALAVYGQAAMQRDYGQLRPIPAERVQTSTDGHVIELAGRRLQLLDTPGHARHHHCIWDETSRGIFSGDTFGLSYRELDTERGPWTFITSTPVQFEPELLRASIMRLLTFDPQYMYLTHFGRVGSIASLARQQLGLLDQLVALGTALRSAPERHVALKLGLRRLYEDALRAHGCQLSADALQALLAPDIELNAQGMGVWLDRL